jgi:small subunit ribosomal protein S18
MSKTATHSRPLTFKLNASKCFFCNSGTFRIDHKDVELINFFVNPYNGKIKPSRTTGTCPKHQHMISNAIKRARIIALIPFVKE